MARTANGHFDSPIRHADGLAGAPSPAGQAICDESEHPAESQHQAPVDDGAIGTRAGHGAALHPDQGKPSRHRQRNAAGSNVL